MLRRKQTKTVMPHPHQSLGATDLAGLQRYQRLVVELQITGSEGMAQAARHPPAFGGVVPLTVRPYLMAERGCRQNDAAGSREGR
jgi:hypothetical protein